MAVPTLALGKQLQDAARSWQLVGGVAAVLVLVGSLIVWRQLDSFALGLGTFAGGLVPVLPLFAVARLMALLGEVEIARENERMRRPAT
jgi:hypothetical protein